MALLIRCTPKTEYFKIVVVLMFDPLAATFSFLPGPLLVRLLPPASASGLKMEIKKRGVPPKGGGRIIFTSKPAGSLSPIQLTAPGKVYRVRGVSWTCRVSPGIASQLMRGAKQLLNKFLSDVYLNLDHRRRKAAGGSSGFGVVLWAETKEGVFYTAEACSAAEDDTPTSHVPIVPSELGFEAASRLLDQIYLGGCVDESLQGRNASQLLISEPTPHTIQTLRLLRKVIGVTFDLTYTDRMKLNEGGEKRTNKEEMRLEKANVNRMDDREENANSFPERPVPLVATCFGSGLKNINLSIRSAEQENWRGRNVLHFIGMEKVDKAPRHWIGVNLRLGGGRRSLIIRIAPLLILSCKNTLQME
ncbi:hypothetical protein TcWFU_010536 [Taenia crassiceps]|uniref:RNA 3'-terminal phosphate cyclase-like protein n=1 Tax=Taenia crassiceps TaxID=6207 RepID=A0ABR4QAC2_9CEST